MTRELNRYYGGAAPASRAAQAAQSRIQNDMRTELANVSAIESVAIGAMCSAAHLKQFQQNLELATPAASEMLNLIASTAGMSLARCVMRFGVEHGG